MVVFGTCPVCVFVDTSLSGSGYGAPVVWPLIERTNSNRVRGIRKIRFRLAIVVVFIYTALSHNAVN